MKIRGWHVDRAGALEDHDVRDLPEGLTIVCGPNGSGKSTVFSFLRRALFGSVAQRGATHASSPPLGAGHLWCEGPAGEVTISQTDDPSAPPGVTRGDGRGGGLADIETCFGGADRRSIGALLTFNEDDLRAPLSGMLAVVRRRPGQTDADALLDRFRRALERTEARLSALRQRAGDPQRLFDLPAELEAAIARAKQAAQRCCHLLCVQARTRLELESLADDLANLRAERATCDSLIDLAPAWQALLHAREELARLEPVPELPADIEARLERALEESQTSPSEGLIAWQRRLKEVVETVRDREGELDATRRRLLELEAERDRIQSTIGPEPPTLASLEEGTRLVHQVRSGITGIAEEEAATRRLQDRIAACGETIRSLETHPVRHPSRVFLYGGWLGAIAGPSAMAVRAPLAPGLESGALIVCSLVCLLGAIVERSRHKAFAATDLDRRARLVALKTDLQDACHELLIHQERESRRRYDVGVDSARLGLRPLPSERQLRVLETDLLASRQQRLVWESAQSTLADLQTARDESKTRERQQAQAVHEARLRQQDAIEEWRQWKARAGLGTGVEARRTGADSPLSRLCAEAGVADESGLRARIAAERRYRDAERAIAGCEARLHERMPRDRAADAWLQALSAGTVEQWREDTARLADALADIEVSHAAAVRQLREIDQQICAASTDAARLAGLEMERDALRTEAVETIREWRAVAAAAALLAAARRRDERLCQPPAVLNASRRFFAITSRYELALKPGAAHDLTVSDVRGGEKSVEQLSRATLEQLQFSLRLGIADELARSGVRLPVLIDDVLDTGDSARRRAMAEQVVDISRGRQVLLFTSRSETRDLLRELDPAAHTIVMHEL